MAEFVEVMGWAYRICIEHKGRCCHKCPLLTSYGQCRFQISEILTDPRKLEPLIMDWAAEHPEPVYPTWKDAWVKLFPNACEVPCPRKYFDEGCFPIFICAKHDCDRCKALPMDPEIAEKLGIRPKEE